MPDHVEMITAGDLWDYYESIPAPEYALNLRKNLRKSLGITLTREVIEIMDARYRVMAALIAGRGYGKRATLEEIRTRAINRPASAITQTELLTLDPETVKWRCIRPAFLTDPVGVARARAILDRKRGKNGTSHPKVPETARKSAGNRV